MYIARHGYSGQYDGTSSDDARTLQDPDSVRAVAAELASLGQRPLAIYTSPIIRCKQTSAIYAAQFSCPVTVVGWLSNKASPNDTLQGLYSVTGKRIMLVSHVEIFKPLLDALTSQDTDKLVMGEVRKCKRSGKEKWRIRPSDVGFKDYA